MTRLKTLLGTTGGRVAFAVTALVVVLAAVLLLVLPGGGEPGPTTAAPPSSAPSATTELAEPATTTDAPAPRFPTTVAAAVVDEVDVFDGPSTDGGPARTLRTADELSGQLVFVVDAQEGDWLDVQLPARPNGSTGWIRASDVSLTSHDYSIEVQLTAHRMVVRQAAEVVLDTPIGVGTTDAPTPGGSYYVKELLQPPDPAGGYGPYAYGLSGFSDVFTSYSGGAGVIGIHGTNKPETVGTDVSDGCVRVSNEVVTQMVDDIGLPLGTPVVIVA